MRRILLITLSLLVMAIAVIAVGCSNISKNLSVNSPATLTQGLSTENNLFASKPAQVPGDSEKLLVMQEKLAQDFKSDIMYGFKAWKAKNIAEFRQIIEQGYGGDLLEQKVKEAEEFIADGEGAEVDNVDYSDVKITNLEGNKATIEADFDYSGYEYNPLSETRGDKVGPIRQQRVYTLELKDKQWYITAEQEKAGNS